MDTSYISGILLKENINIEVKYAASIDSTNDELKRMAVSGYKNDCVLISEKQTKGKGRRGRSFYSPAGTGVYISFLIHPSLPMEDIQKFTTLTAVAAAAAIENVSGKFVSIKWVNDLLLDNKKISGILTETSPVINNNIPEYVVVGIGINIFEPDGGFPEEIKNSAGAVYPAGKSISHTDDSNTAKCRICTELIMQFFKYYNASDGIDSGYINEYRKRLFIIGKDVDILTPEHESLHKKAHVLGINDKCHLHVKYEDGTEEYLSGGEISIRL